MSDEREWADSPYVRVYQSVRTDQKFASLVTDLSLLGAWLRLLLEADPAWPAPAALPQWLEPNTQERLTKAGVLIVTGDTYTVSGMRKERKSRAMTNGERQAAWRDRHRPSQKSTVTPDVTSVTEDVVTSVTPRGRARASASVLVSDRDNGNARDAGQGILHVVDYLEERTGRPYQYGPGSKVHETLSADIRDLGPVAVLNAMIADPTPRPDIGQLVFGATRVLHPIASVKDVRVNEDRAAFDRGVERTQREQRRVRGESA